ncbi:hypothetical protein WDW37_15120 [Bdellovibrionota bacterium FG-1]
MKKIYLDPGAFYTKVYVLESTASNGFKFFGRSFFPTAAAQVLEIPERVIGYEHGGSRYLVGSDCPGDLWNVADTSDAGLARNALIIKLIVNKALFDYADSDDEVELHVVVDTPEKRGIFEAITTERTGKLTVAGFRGPKKIAKTLTLQMKVLPTSDGVLGYLRKIKAQFDSSLFVDIGYSSTKLYVASARQGVEKFATFEFGARFYLDAIIRALKDEGIGPLEPYWLTKQLELGCKSLEVTNEGHASRQVDVSLILENARWDTNKDFKRITVDFMTDYYNNNSRWPGLLVVTGGGALFNGDLLCTALAHDGYRFDDLFIDKSPLYTVLEGLARSGIH